MNLLSYIKRFLSKNSYLDFVSKFIVVNVSQMIFSLKYNRINIENETIVFECFQGRNISDSPYAIYKKIIDDYGSENYKFIWVLDKRDNASQERVIKNKNTSFVLYGTKEYDEVYAKSKYWVTNCRLPFRIKKKIEQKYIQCWHGTPLKKLGHDISQGANAINSLLGLKYGYHVDSVRYDKFISPSRYATECFYSSFKIQKEIILELGYPRNDYLVNNKHNEKEKNRIRNSLNIGTDKKVVLYAPTWRDNQFSSKINSHFFDNRLEDEKFLSEFGEEYVFIFRGHYFTKTAEDNLFFINVSEYNDVNELYLISDILITDYSSVFFDYALLERPILFFMYDRSQYENENRGFYIDVESQLPGPICETIDELVSVMRNMPEKALNRGFNELYNPYEDGDSTKRVVEEVFN
ncbi:CDP-glycerol glycerophosphotransferase family protein [Photobacterium makurazakiensis]|uniref:CDP-glycerol glycerophosphotransferase family protein n=1 Tax=Photobacterium makurazakiensis TaxID=2910234 RepID=UPI003D0CAABB